jgi:thioredoxin reductase
VRIADDGRPRNQASDHANNLPAHDGIAPAAWRAHVREDLRKYETVQFAEGTVKSLRKEGDRFVAEWSTGERAEFRKVILAYGVKDRLPTAPGFQELWGKAVFHCPYCHGFEVRGKRLGFVGNGKFAEHLVPMLFGLSRQLTVFTQGKPDLPPEFLARMKEQGVTVYEGKIEMLHHQGTNLKAVVLGNGERIAVDGLFAAPSLPFELKSSLADHLGCEKTEMGLIKVAERGITTVPGVFAAGDMASPMHSVLGAAASGQMAGAGVAAELLHEDFMHIRHI